MFFTLGFTRKAAAFSVALFAFSLSWARQAGSDLDGDCDIDQDDVDIVSAAAAEAARGAYKLLDWDGDGKVTAEDAEWLAAHCHRPGCARQDSPSGPSIAFAQPFEAMLSSSSAVVMGQVGEGAASVMVNGRQAFLQGGRFQAQVELEQGGGCIVAAAADKEGNTRTVVRRVSYSIRSEEIDQALRGVWRIESRHLAEGGVLRPPQIFGAIAINETHTVAYTPDLFKPDSNDIAASHNDFEAPSPTLQVFYRTSSANSLSDDVSRNLPPQEVSFGRRLKFYESRLFEEMTGRFASALDSPNTIVQRLPDAVSRVFAGDSLAVITSQSVDFYRRQTEAATPNNFLQGMTGGWDLQERRLPDGRTIPGSELTGLVFETPNYSFEMIPLVSNHKVNLIIGAETSADLPRTIQLFFLTTSANGKPANKIHTTFPPEKCIFDTDLTPQEEELLLKGAGITKEDLPAGYFVQRLPDTPSYLYAGDRMYEFDETYFDIYQRAKKGDGGKASTP